jgi:hypothetical protein
VPILVLGSSSETSGDYPDEGVCFRSRPITSEELLASTSELVAKHQYHAA